MATLRQDSMSRIPAITNLFESPVPPLDTSSLTGRPREKSSPPDAPQGSPAPPLSQDPSPEASPETAQTPSGSPPSDPIPEDPSNEEEPPPSCDNHSYPPSQESPTEKAAAEKFDRLAAADPQKVFETFKRDGGEAHRRMTFRIQALPDAVTKGHDMFVEEAKAQCGEDLLLEDVASDDEEPWILESLPTPEKLPGVEDKTSAESQKELQQALMLELDKANDETDVLFDQDDLADAETLNDSAGDSNATAAAAKKQAKTPTPDPPRSSPEKPSASMDPLALRLWFVKLRQSYKKGVKVVKVNGKGLKYIRTVTIIGERLAMNSPNGGSEIHLAAVLQVQLGYTSQEFRHLLDVTSENEPVPPPSVCAVVAVPNRTISLIFLTESSRNEFLYLMRVEVREAKRRYGDLSEQFKTRSPEI